MQQNRILFVDDEPLTREHYSSLSRHVGPDYEVLTVSSGKEAMDLLAARPADVVVSDMQMPEMSGPEFLTHVEREHPETMRVVISAYADQLAIARCLMFGHRYFQKPLNMPELAETLKRVCQLKKAIRNEKVRKSIGSTSTLPSPPETYLRLTEALDAPNTSIADLAEIIQVDPGMTAKLLQIVNSAQFGLARRITTPAEAVQYAGVDVLRALMLGIHSLRKFESKQPRSVSLSDLWGHMLDTAIGARMIAEEEKLGFDPIQECFVAGLLHDVGKLVLASNADKEYEAVIRKSRNEKIPIYQIEQEVFGATHADIGGYLLGLWGLPEPIVRSVELHHSLTGLKESGCTPLVAVHAAQNLSRGSSRRVGSLDRDFLKRSGLADRIETWTGLLQP
jgi:HD-like signal output (HDOD) protein